MRDHAYASETSLLYIISSCAQMCNRTHRGNKRKAHAIQIILIISWKKNVSKNQRKINVVLEKRSLTHSTAAPTYLTTLFFLRIRIFYFASRDEISYK